MSSYLVGVDIGGTFTDCVVIDDGGGVFTAKSPSTPEDYSRGMLDAMSHAAERIGISLSELCRATRRLAHGTTIGTNAVVQKRGATVGLITTKGHSDVIHIMRGSRGLTGRDARKVVHFPESQKPEPIVPKKLIKGVSERVDCFGKVVVPLNEAEAEAAVDCLVTQGVEAIAVCFLWSFKYPQHEQRVKEIIAARAPDVFVTCSSDLVPKWGEYERTTAVALNAYIGPLTAAYLRRLDHKLKSLGHVYPLQITQCGGGTISVEKATVAPLLTLDSGPVSGVIGSKFLGDLMGYHNIITTDMGGTSFDVGLISAGVPAFSYTSVVNQYEYFLPKVNVETIGSGGGSLVRLNAALNTLTVGPESAGAVPGPVCYQRGGQIPTVTDAALALGYIDPQNFAGGRLTLDKAGAEAAIGAIGKALNLNVHECAAGIIRIAELQMADLIRRMTVQKGVDPRDFVLFAFGGAGPMHASIFAFEVGVQKVIVPQKKMASTWCAFGAAAADVLHIHERVDIMSSPFSAEALGGNFSLLRQRAEAELAAEGVAQSDWRFEYSLDMRHRGQIHEVEVPLASSEITAEDLSPLRERFYGTYEQLYGRGSSFRGARVEIVTFRLRARAETKKPRIVPTLARSRSIGENAKRGERQIYWSTRKAIQATPIFDGEALMPGNQIAGPAIIETPDTSVVLHPGRLGSVDALGNIEITLIT